MNPIRATAGVAMLALVLVLAACAQGTANPSTAQPSAPAPSESASDEPAPSESPAAPSDEPSDEPSETPDPTESPEPEIVELDVPIVARVTEDGVEVRTEPRADAPLVTAEDLTGSGEEPEVVLGTDDRVLVTLGPVLADGESFYEVAAADGSELHFAFGWIPGRLLEAESAPPGFAPMARIHGQGDGAEASAEVLAGSLVTVRFAATPMPDDDECDIDVTLLRTDGAAVNVATNEVSDVLIFELGPNQLSSLFQEEPGTVTLQVETDCSFAATMITP